MSFTVPEYGCRRGERRASEPRPPRCSTGSRGFGDGTVAELQAPIGLMGLNASFFTIIYAYGRNTYPLSRAGYFPKRLSITHGNREHGRRRADRWSRHRLLPGRADLPAGQERGAAGWADRRRAAVHGGVRRRDLVLHAVPVVHPAAPQAAEHPAAVPQPRRRGAPGSPVPSR